MGSRRDLILSLAKNCNRGFDSSQESSSSPRASRRKRNALGIEENEVLKNKLNRYVDYNDTPVIFDFYNEYKTSFKDIQQNKISLAKLRQSVNLQSKTNPKSQVENALLCDETMPESDEEHCKSQQEPNATFFDCVRDKDYILEDLSSSEYDNVSSTRKIIVSTSQALPLRLSSASPPRRSIPALSPGTRCSLSGTPSKSDKDRCKLQQELNVTFFENSDDSVQDKDYIPEDLSSSESDNESYTRKTPASTSQALTLRLPSASPPRRSLPASSPNTTRRVWKHTSPSGTPSLLESGLLRSRSVSPQRLSDQTTPTLLIGLPVPCLPPFSSNTVPVSETLEDKGLNKAGLPRKRRVISEPVIERKKRKLEYQITKLDLKAPCGEKCPKKCQSKFTSLQRENINETFRTLNKESQGIYIKGLVDTKEVKTRRVSQKENYKRGITYAYHLKSSNDERIEVCKTFFLSTLGYNAKNDCRILNILKRNIDDQRDKRGKYIRENKIDRDVIKNHVLKYNPAISHYRREHAPKRLYLPSDINMTDMYKNFCQTEPNTKVSIETYRHVVKKEMNISFANLGNEECEMCALFQEHNKDHIESQDLTCDTCKRYLKHKDNYTKSRINYKFDAENRNETDIKYYSVDLQKVIMLPRMEQYKAAIFCSRIIAFNESFVPLGKSSKNLPIAVLWNETISGRSSMDILSAYRSFFLQNRDTDKIVLWADNCSSQNKNWTLLSFLVNIINSDLIATNTIEIKYFEPGHTFMSADQFHHQVEKNLRNTKVYDFDDYVARVKSVNSMKTVIKEMNVTDFYDYDECVSQHKIRNSSPRIYLRDITHVKVERGYYTLKFKEDQNGEDFRTLDFLQNKVIKNKSFPELRPKVTPRGITEEKKKEIVDKLVPLMPENRRAFWLNIPISDASNFLED